MPSFHFRTENPGITIRTLPANIGLEDQDLFLPVSRYKRKGLSVEYLGQVRISPDSVIYKYGRVLPESVIDPALVGYYRWRHLVKGLVRFKQVSLPKGRDYVLVTDGNSSGHFHWFMEVLPKICVIEQNAHRLTLLLPDTPYVRTIGLESLKLLGIEFADIVWLRSDKFYKVPSMYYVPRMTSHEQINDDRLRDLRSRLRSDRPAGNRRLYVSRSDARRRKVLNESELEPVLHEFGFEIARPDNLSLAEQIDLFSGCSVLMGIHGAGLTNCLFMPGGGDVVEFQKREPNFGYWHLSDALGHRFHCLFGEPDSELSLIGSGCNLTVAVEDLRRVLKVL
jgi:hypothetical protein